MKDYLVLFLISFIFISCEDESIELIEDTGTLPKVCISIDEQYLWSPDSGLYLIGSNGKEMCGQIANYNQKWEFPANIKLFEHGEQLFDEKVGLICHIKNYLTGVKFDTARNKLRLLVGYSF